jgi:hypothetical protein
MADQDFAAELAQAKEEIEALRRRIALLENRLEAIPDTLLLSKNQTVRSLAVLGHGVLGLLAIGIVLLLLRALFS